MGALPRMQMTEDEYLAYDASHEGKHEYVNGELIAMAGASEAHDRATVNLLVLLAGRLAGSPCRLHTADFRVRIDETGLYAYPDLSVVCGKAELTATNPPSLLNPTVVVEVTSPSTEAHDRGAKAAHYRRRASIQAIVFVSTEERRVEVLTRSPDGSWRLIEATEGVVPVPPIGVELPIDAVYAGFDALAEAAAAPGGDAG